MRRTKARQFLQDYNSILHLLYEIVAYSCFGTLCLLELCFGCIQIQGAWRSGSLLACDRPDRHRCRGGSGRRSRYLSANITDRGNKNTSQEYNDASPGLSLDPRLPDMPPLCLFVTIMCFCTSRLLQHAAQDPKVLFVAFRRCEQDLTQ